MKVYHAAPSPASAAEGEKAAFVEKKPPLATVWVFLSQTKSAYELLDYGCRKVWGLNAAPSIARQGRGKPYFPTYPQWGFSLSHSGKYALCALGEGAVGCDVERYKVRSEGLPRRVFGADMGWEEFYRRWTEMEAYGKLTGDGIGALVGTGFRMPDGIGVVQKKLEDGWLSVCAAGRFEVRLEER